VNNGHHERGRAQALNELISHIRPRRFHLNQTRRKLLAGISIAGAGALLVGCRTTPNSPASASNDEPKNDEPGAEGPASGEVTATEDLMREHGILRRALLVYQESAIKLRQDPNSVPPDVLEKAAKLFRVFGEDYHEKKLEEAYIFPVLKKSQGAASALTDVLLAQHARGREITDYLLSVTKADKIPSNSLDGFVASLEAFVRMYEHHAAVEDTIVFPAWKAAVGVGELDELGAKFEEIEEAEFGGDGFVAAANRMAEIEESLGLAKLEMFTAPPPPGSSR
jgi:hemerythrin-like domain-containing protein